MHYSSSSVLIFVFWCLFIFHNAEGSKLPEGVTVPAIFVFGDSIVDSGNNNHIITTCRSNFVPYGRDFEECKPTGRFTNGKVPSDLFAEAFGVKELVPPYLDPSLTMDDLLTGVNFASACSGYLPATALHLSPSLSLEDQLDLFKEYISKLTAEVGEQKTSSLLSQGILLLATGSNDFNYFYDTQKNGNITAFLDILVNYTSGFLTRLYDLGVRKFAVGSAPPTGSLPLTRTNKGGLLRFPVEFIDRDCLHFNNKLEKLLSSLQNKLHGSRFVFLDVYHELLTLIHNPHDTGFEVVNRGCCGTGLFEEGFLCNVFSIPFSCKHTSKYVFWDGSHPTQAAYKHVLDRILNVTMPHFF
ncbi:GDSL esterase/lipase-like protein [Drosera capensis]